jgi:hypothetical protein
MKALVRLVLPLALLAPLSSCIFVHVDGDVPEEWLNDVVHTGALPESVEEGHKSLVFVGRLGSTTGEFEMSFACDEEDLEAYLAGICEGVEAEIAERDCEITEVVEGPRSCNYRYHGADERGRVEIEIEEDSDEPSHPYRLSITWKER